MFIFVCIFTIKWMKLAYGYVDYNIARLCHDNHRSCIIPVA